MKFRHPGGCISAANSNSCHQARILSDLNRKRLVLPDASCTFLLANEANYHSEHFWQYPQVLEILGMCTTSCLYQFVFWKNKHPAKEERKCLPLLLPVLPNTTLFRRNRSPNDPGSFDFPVSPTALTRFPCQCSQHYCVLLSHGSQWDEPVRSSRDKGNQQFWKCQFPLRILGNHFEPRFSRDC